MKAWYVNRTSTQVVVRIDHHNRIDIRSYDPRMYGDLEKDARRNGYKIVDITGRKNWTIEQLRNEVVNDR